MFRFGLGLLGLTVLAFVAGCATPASGIAGYGGVTEQKDSFTGVAEIVTGKGFVYAPKGDGGLLPISGIYLSFVARSSLPNELLVTLTYDGYENLRALQINIDGELVSLPPLDAMTEFSSASRPMRESYQRYSLPLDLAHRLIAAQSVLMRVELLNNRVSLTGDFTRPTSMGQPSAKELLRTILAKTGNES